LGEGDSVSAKPPLPPGEGRARMMENSLMGGY